MPDIIKDTFLNAGSITCELHVLKFIETLNIPGVTKDQTGQISREIHLGSKSKKIYIQCFFFKTCCICKNWRTSGALGG